jgi:EAL domain-containing protein (putative c-di-GMP-specific phosphodiesterase class I)
LGCRFVLNNFGSGMASFTHLKVFPVDFLKIDGVFIKNITHDKIEDATVEAINNIAHLMHISTIAENVENQATLNRLKEIGIDYVQGYWIDEPKPLEKMQHAK